MEPFSSSGSRPGSVGKRAHTDTFGSEAGTALAASRKVGSVAWFAFSALRCQFYCQRWSYQWPFRTCWSERYRNFRKPALSFEVDAGEQLQARSNQSCPPPVVAVR